jgi:hypothetical protein
VVAAVRLRAGRAGSAKGAASMLTEAVNTATAVGADTDDILVRGDSAYGNGKVIAAVVKAGARFSFTWPATARSTPRSRPSPTRRTPRCTTPARSPTPTPAT